MIGLDQVSSCNPSTKLITWLYQGLSSLLRLRHDTYVLSTIFWSEPWDISQGLTNSTVERERWKVSCVVSAILTVVTLCFYISIQTSHSFKDHCVEFLFLPTFLFVIVYAQYTFFSTDTTTSNHVSHPFPW